MAKGFTINVFYTTQPMIRVYYDKKYHYYSAGVQCDKKHFNSKAQNFNYISRKDSNYKYKNQILQKEFVRIEKALYELVLNDMLSHGNIKMVLDLANQVSSYTIVAFAKKYLIDKNLSEGSYRRYSFYLTEFLEKEYPKHYITSIDVRLLTEMQTKLNKKYKGSNTVHACLKFIRSLVNYAMDSGIKMKYPFGRQQFSIPSYKQPHRNHLSKEQIEAIEKLEFNDPGLSNCRDYFMFGVYTGLRYSDVIRFESSWISSGRLYFSDKKTKTPQYVPVDDKIQHYADIIKKLPKYSNEDLNLKLKLIGTLANIPFPLTFHISRHTFAVSFLDDGGSMETLNKLLGHSSMRTTEIYGKITNKRMDEEFKRVRG